MTKSWCLLISAWRRAYIEIPAWASAWMNKMGKPKNIQTMSLSFLIRGNYASFKLDKVAGRLWRYSIGEHHLVSGRDVASGETLSCHKWLSVALPLRNSKLLRIHNVLMTSLSPAWRSGFAGLIFKICADGFCKFESKSTKRGPWYIAVRHFDQKPLPGKRSRWQNVLKDGRF